MRERFFSAVGPHFKKRVESLDMEQQFDIRALILE